MRTEVLRESTPSSLHLTDAEAAAIGDAGRRLASRTEWWGSAGGQDNSMRSVIDCVRIGGHNWRVLVRDAVGIVAVGTTLQLIIRPKIPITHFLYLLETGRTLPRLSTELGVLAAGDSLWELIARWFVTAVHHVLRRDLLRDYSSRIEELPAVQGSIAPIETAQHYYGGRLTVTCGFDEFALDMPINRLLKAALRVVIASPLVTFETRRTAQRADMRFDDIGDARSSDFRAVLDRRSAHYGDALSLAKHILQNCGRSLETGDRRVWTFLFRTPDLIEQGIRQLMHTRFGPATIGKRSIGLGQGLTMNPDVVIADGAAIADVKYKLAGADLNRTDLYQVVAFATAFRSRHAGILGFRADGNGAARPALRIGDIEVRHVLWMAYENISPYHAAEQFLDDVAQWLDAVKGEAIRKESTDADHTYDHLASVPAGREGNRIGLTREREAFSAGRPQRN